MGPVPGHENLKPTNTDEILNISSVGTGNNKFRLVFQLQGLAQRSHLGTASVNLFDATYWEITERIYESETQQENFIGRSGGVAPVRG